MQRSICAYPIPQRCHLRMVCGIAAGQATNCGWATWQAAVCSPTKMYSGPPRPGSERTPASVVGLWLHCDHRWYKCTRTSRVLLITAYGVVRVTGERRGCGSAVFCCVHCCRVPQVILTGRVRGVRSPVSAFFGLVRGFFILLSVSGVAVPAGFRALGWGRAFWALGASFI